MVAFLQLPPLMPPPLMPWNVLSYALPVTGAQLVFDTKRDAYVWSCAMGWRMHECGWKRVRLLVC